MKNSTRVLLILSGLVVVLFLGALIFALLPTHTHSIAAREPAAADAASIERGRYLAVTADCTACHTASYVLQHRFDEAGWNAIVELMKNVNV